MSILSYIYNFLVGQKTTDNKSTYNKPNYTRRPQTYTGVWMAFDDILDL